MSGPLFDAAVLDHGVDGTKLLSSMAALPTTGTTGTAQAFTSVTSNLTATLVGPWRDIAGADEHGEYAVIVPQKQTDGATGTTNGTLTVTLDFCDDAPSGAGLNNQGSASTTVLETVTRVITPAAVGSGATAYILFATGRRYVRTTLTPAATQNFGNVVAGLVQGNHRRAVNG